MKLAIPKIRQRNSGAVLIVLLVAILAASSFWLLEIADANRESFREQERVTESLSYAKEALLAYAVSYADNYGHNIRGGAGRLPCPASKKHSGPALSCGKGKTGYLPAVWSRGKKRLDIDHIEKFLDKDFWYSVSPSFRFNPAYNVLNSDSNADLISIGSIDDVVAVIIAPGAPLKGQSRTHAGVGIADYLEGDNADQDLEFSVATTAISGISNDQLLWIRRSELLPLIEKRVLGYVRDWLQEYYQEFGYYPYAAPFESTDGGCQTGLTMGRLPMDAGNCTALPLGKFVSVTVAKSRTLDQIWFTGSDWPDLIYYQVNPVCTQDNLPGNCSSQPQDYKLNVDGTAAKVLLVSAGAVAESVATGGLQSRNPNARALTDYFEVPDLLSGQSQLDFRSASSLSNDQYVVIK